MATKLYVGGLSYDTTEQTVREAFAQAGSVESATIITDREAGRSRGFGFVEMSSEEEARKAIQMLNNTMLDGKSIIVNEARQRPSRDRSSRSGGRNRPGSYRR